MKLMSEPAAKPTAQDIIRAIRDRGSDADTLRDAAHEACHALEFSVPEGEWDRDSIDNYAQSAIQKKGREARVFALRSEILARAVEQLVCRAVGAECPAVEACALVACKEALTIDRVMIDPQLFVVGVKNCMGSVEAKKMLDRVLALPAAPPRFSKNPAFRECDACGNRRRDVRAYGRDGNGDPDAPCLCGSCVEEGRDGNVWDRERQCYRPDVLDGVSA